MRKPTQPIAWPQTPVSGLELAHTWLICVGSRRCSNGPRRWRRTRWTGSASALYERFRPEVPEGVAGWVARAVLDLGRIRNAAV